ncbi:MAG: hypothetical protein EPO24_03005 [Bacteroidetes bacterium]|nr:MAG: hypothetical protein EPO24_03005 [Bacteroidota bacterium]
MKRLLLILTAVGALLILSGEGTYAKSGVRFSLFYSSLSPYGEWVDCSYGHVWRPVNMHHGWRPYLYGRWVWTDYGWYWYSDEPFGWATFHYGRWVYDDFYGWVWTPDDVWGPAWVEWRYSDDYIGWAPLSPAAQFSFSVGISFSSGWSTPVHYWNFVPSRSFTLVRIVDYVQPVDRTRRFFGNTRHVHRIDTDGDRVINRGVDVNFVERRTRTRIERTEVTTRTEAGRDKMVRAEGRSRLEVYKPRMEGSTRETGVERRESGTRRYDTRKEATGAERRTQELNRTESSRRHYEVQRNSELRRETFEQRKQQQRDDRQTDVNRSFQNRERKEVQRREPQIQRRNEQQPTQERRIERGARPTQQREMKRVERAPQQKREKPPSEGRQQRRRP